LILLLLLLPPAATDHKADTPAIAADPESSCHCTPQIPYPKNTTKSKFHTTQGKQSYPKNLIWSFLVNKSPTHLSLSLERVRCQRKNRLEWGEFLSKQAQDFASKTKQD